MSMGESTPSHILPTKSNIESCRETARNNPKPSSISSATNKKTRNEMFRAKNSNNAALNHASDSGVSFTSITRLIYYSMALFIISLSVVKCMDLTSATVCETRSAGLILDGSSAADLD